ncbi:hypothetical protein KKC32_02975 [Patescibacteria group bacterium]|nr:hypothetical protein [Patescibacteria group bacterium]
MRTNQLIEFRKKREKILRELDAEIRSMASGLWDRIPAELHNFRFQFWGNEVGFFKWLNAITKDHTEYPAPTGLKYGLPVFYCARILKDNLGNNGFTSQEQAKQCFEQLSRHWKGVLQTEVRIMPNNCIEIYFMIDDPAFTQSAD